MVEKHNLGNLSRQSTLRQAAGVPDGFNYSHDNASSPLDLGASDEAPPAYGEVHDQLNLSQDGFNAGASVTGELQPRSGPLQIPTSTVLKFPLRRWSCRYQHQPDQPEALPAFGPGFEGSTTPFAEDSLGASATGVHTPQPGWSAWSNTPSQAKSGCPDRRLTW